MSRRLPVRKVWFAEGARALRALLRERGEEHLLPTDEDWYGCPLCLSVVFKIEGLEAEPEPLLTDEHAPPEWAGGKEMVLTCRTCNNKAGDHFDGEAHKLERVRSFLAGDTDRAERIGLTVDGVTNYGTAHVGSDGSLVIIGGPTPKANSKADVERMIEVLDSYVGTDGSELSFQIQPRVRFDHDVARVSWIRAAYLVAFAGFGWRYLFQPALEPLRAQFRDFDKVTIPVLSRTDPDGDPSRREVWVVKEPFEQRCVLVVYGRHQVFLPVLNDPRTLEDFSRAIVSSPEGLEFTGDMYPWPTKPYYSLDPVPAE